MNVQNIREAFLGYFQNKDHKIVKSASLLPKDDPTLLFTNAGMNQFKNVFLGLEKRSYSRAASVQKCMRVSGKHNDLEQVGRTSKHHTFFEMLGNFSFGDYFKQDAISMAWELVRNVFGLAEAQLYATVYEEDDDAYQIWEREIGIPSDRLFRMGKADNYWSMGETGPCGPCSEIHFDLDPKADNSKPRDLIENGSDRVVELWNLVFMQFNRDPTGTLHPLPAPSVDTGMGLERTAMVLQGKTSNYETDVFRPLIEAVCDLCGCEYSASTETDIGIRVIADHIRAVTFLIGDGIMPANDGRGYVLRRLIRRAFRYGNRLGREEPFLYRLVGVVGDSMKDAYPELLASLQYIARVCQSEEQRFSTTLASGLKSFQQYADEARARGDTRLSGASLFKLYDTFGFPIDLSRELAEEENLEIDEPGFHVELEQQRSKARASWKGAAAQQKKQVYEPLKDLDTRFVGYEHLRGDCRVVALMRDECPVEELRRGEEGEVFLEETPFYAEAGGQIGDRGVLKNARFSAVVENAFYPIPDLISQRVRVLSGSVRLGDRVEAEVEASRRRAISRNHTATHLLHTALRQSLGDHVKQAGSLVSYDHFRFDFTHFSALSPEEIRGLEETVNRKIRENLAVTTRIMSLEEGILDGATAIFEEKYGDRVRVVSIGDFSKELCGGVHVSATGEIGFFKITSEGSIAAGMRRIEAVTGESAQRYVSNVETLLNSVVELTGSTREDLISQIEKLKSSHKRMDKENRSLRQKLASRENLGTGEKIQTVGNLRLVTREVTDLNAGELRNLADQLKQKVGSGIVVLGCRTGDKAVLVAAVSTDLTSQIPADDLIRRIAPLVGGGGGGRPDFAQAGGSQPDRLKEALEAVPGILAKAGGEA